MIRALTLAAAMILPGAASAQEALGTIEGTLDLDDARWTVAEREEAPASGWRRDGEMLEAVLVGLPRPGAEDLSGALVLEMTVARGAEPARAAGHEIRWRSANGTVWHAGGDAAALELTAVSQAGDTLSLAGSVVGRLERDGEGSMTIDARFQATLPRLME